MRLKNALASLPSGAQSSSSWVTSPSWSSPQGQAKRTRKTDGRAGPANRSTERKRDSRTRASPLAGHRKV